MLQILNSPSVQLEEGGSTHDNRYSAQSSPVDVFANIIGFVRRQFPVVLSVVPLTVGLAALYLFTTPPLYSAEARMMIAREKVQLFQHTMFGEDPATAAMMDSLLEILKSENFALSIVKNLHLMRDTEFVTPNRSLIGIARGLVSKLFMSNENKLKSELELTRQAVGVFVNRLTVSRVGVTYVIEIKFQSTNPDRASEIANAVADTFIVDQLEARYQTIKTTTAWLQDRLTELRAQASAAESAVVEYKTKNNIVDTGGQLVSDQQLVELNATLLRARGAKAEAEVRLARVAQILGSRDSNTAAAAGINHLFVPQVGSPPIGAAGTVVETLQNPVITHLREQYLELAQREALFSNRYGKDHLATVNIRNRMREIGNSINDEFRRIAEADKSDYDIAQAREKALEKNLAEVVATSQTTNKAQIELRQLQSAAQTYRALYDNLQQRYMDSVQQQSFPMTEGRVITRASPPSAKTSPKSFLILAGGTIGGLVLGLGLAILREIADRVFRTGKQVEARLGTECVAIVPMIKPDNKAGPMHTNRAVADLAASRIIAPNVGLLGYVVDSPLSAFAESMRAVKMSVDLVGAAKSNQVIGITSSLPNEGKSTIAASLAQLSADGGARVILVDCDLRKPTLSQKLVPDATPGLIDVINNLASLDRVTWSDPSTRLFFLPVGTRSRLTHTSEILASDAMKRLFARLRESYEYVIVDLSPLAPVVDVRSATHLLDSYVFVIEWGKTKIHVAEHALNSARGVYDNLLGVVLNKVDLKALSRYDSHGDYYYNRHYARYGYTD
jgi:polysaccharide biosynthesis transport protein